MTRRSGSGEAEAGTRELAPAALHWTCDEALAARGLRERRSFPAGAIGQERALEALHLGLGIEERGFNIFVAGPPGTGRTSTVRRLLDERARTRPAAQDLVLLHNFEDAGRPLAVLVPAGAGPSIEEAYADLVMSVLVHLEVALQSEVQTARRKAIEDRSARRVEVALARVGKAARRAGFVLTRAGTAFTLAAADPSGAPLTDEQQAALPAKRRAEIERRGKRLVPMIEAAAHRVLRIEGEAEKEIESLVRETAESVAAPHFAEAKAAVRDCPRVLAHLDAVRADLMDELEGLFPSSQGPRPPGAPPASTASWLAGQGHSPALRYRVNVLVTHAAARGAPVVHEPHPTTANLIGRIEHLEHATPSTDFTRIGAGALLRANGGYLVLEAVELARDPAAWEALKRALRNRAVELEDPGEPGRIVTPPSLRPEPVPLDVKVCLIGTFEAYRAYSTDPDFAKLLKVKAEFEVDVERTPDRVQAYAGFLGALARGERLRLLTPGGAARVVEHAARLAERGGRLTTRFGALGDLVREAAYHAGRAGVRRIARAHVVRALKARREREGVLERHFLESAAAGRIAVETRGAVAGQVNGLTVIDAGGTCFGAPARVTCRVGAGSGTIIDVEREADLGGPIYGKASLILRGLLVDRLGREAPLSLDATICLEQSYSEIEGDSATLAEACALFSALAGAPIDQRFAVTGSLDQRGRVQAVGGLDEKIEGFFRLCRATRAAGRHVVIVPEANVPDLALAEDVLAAVREGTFVVLAAATLEGALTALTGRAFEEIRCAARSTLARFHRVRLEAQRGDGPAGVAGTTRAEAAAARRRAAGAAAKLPPSAGRG